MFLAQAVAPRSRRWTIHHAPLLAGFIGLLCLWDRVTLKLAWMPLPYFPGPDMVLQGMIDDRVLLLVSTGWRSLALLLSGYAIGVAAGLSSGILIGWSRTVRYWGMPMMKIVGPIPATAYIPLVMTFFTSAFFSGSLLIALAVWFPMTMLTSSGGCANVPISYLDVARTLGARSCVSDFPLGRRPRCSAVSSWVFWHGPGPFVLDLDRCRVRSGSKSWVWAGISRGNRDTLNIPRSTLH